MKKFKKGDVVKEHYGNWIVCGYDNNGSSEFVLVKPYNRFHHPYVCYEDGCIPLHESLFKLYKRNIKQTYLPNWL